MHSGHPSSAEPNNSQRGDSKSESQDGQSISSGHSQPNIATELERLIQNIVIEREDPCCLIGQLLSGVEGTSLLLDIKAEVLAKGVELSSGRAFCRKANDEMLDRPIQSVSTPDDCTGMAD